MDADTFADELERAYRELYRRTVRRIDDGRDRLSAETIALLGHVAQAGPSTLGELALHLGRAPSTMSAKIATLEADGLLARQRDEDDGRRSLIWLSATGRRVHEEAQHVLDVERLAAAADGLAPDRRALLVELLHELLDHLPTPILPSEPSKGAEP